MPKSEFGRFRYGTNRATGFPRFVITISRPDSATSSISPKHFAVNSVADIVRVARLPCHASRKRPLVTPARL